MKVKDCITYLSRTYTPDTEICFIDLAGDDVYAVAKDIGIKLTDKQVANVLDMVTYEHNSSIGINWDTIENAINEVLKPNE